jgi:transcriptional antiterminator
MKSFCANILKSQNVSHQEKQIEKMLICQNAPTPLKEKQKFSSSLHALKNRQITQDQDTYREDHVIQMYSYLHESGALT